MHLNDVLGQRGEPVSFDTSDTAIDKHFELCLPDDDETGKPDFDLPAFNKNLSVSEINESAVCLVVHNSDGCARWTEPELNQTSIQSFVDSNNYSSTIITKEPGEEVYLSKDAFEKGILLLSVNIRCYSRKQYKFAYEPQQSDLMQMFYFLILFEKYPASDLLFISPIFAIVI